MSPTSLHNNRQITETNHLCLQELQTPTNSMNFKHAKKTKQITRMKSKANLVYVKSLWNEAKSLPWFCDLVPSLVKMLPVTPWSMRQGWPPRAGWLQSSSFFAPYSSEEEVQSGSTFDPTLCLTKLFLNWSIQPDFLTRSRAGLRAVTRLHCGYVWETVLTCSQEYSSALQRNFWVGWMKLMHINFCALSRWFSLESQTYAQEGFTRKARAKQIHDSRKLWISKRPAAAGKLVEICFPQCYTLAIWTSEIGTNWIWSRKSTGNSERSEQQRALVLCVRWKSQFS